MNLLDPLSTLIAGTSQSGKSTIGSVIFSQLPADVLVYGSDVGSNTLGALGEAFGGSHLRALGSDDLSRHVEVFRMVADLMDERNEELSARGQAGFRQPTPEVPLVVFFVEEIPSLIELLSDRDKAEGLRPADRLAPRLQSYLTRINSLCLKSLIRPIYVVQRADVSIFGGGSGFARSQVLRRVQFQGEPDGVRMMLPMAGKDVIERAFHLPPGRAFYGAPGVEPTEFQADFMDWKDFYNRFQNGVAE